MWFPIKSKYPKNVAKVKSSDKTKDSVAIAETLEKELTRLIVKLINDGLEDSKIDPAGEQAVVLLRDSLKKLKQAKRFLERVEGD